MVITHLPTDSEFNSVNRGIGHRRGRSRIERREKWPKKK